MPNTSATAQATATNLYATSPIPPDYDPDLAWPPQWCIMHTSGTILYDAESISTSQDALEAILANLFDWLQQNYSIIPLPWRAREQHKFHSTYTHPIWYTQDWWNTPPAQKIRRDHYVHVSLSNPKLLAYTENPSKGQRDIQTPISPGRYLKKFFGHLLDDKTIAKLAQWQVTGTLSTNYTNEQIYVLRFAQTPDEIEWVYEYGPDSCMSGPASGFASPVHPARVYGAGDLAIAYLQLKSDEDAKPIARALVRPPQGSAPGYYGRVYPTPHRWQADGFASLEESQTAQLALEQRLVAQGYKSLLDHRSGFNGAKLLRIEGDSDREIVCPFLDHGKINLHSDYLEIYRNGKYSANQTSGWLEKIQPYAICENCEDEIEDERDSYTIVTSIRTGRPRHSETWCRHCQENNTFFCYELNEVLSANLPSITLHDATTGEEIHIVSQDWAEQTSWAWQSSYGDQLWYCANSSEAWTTPDGTDIAPCEVESWYCELMSTITWDYSQPFIGAPSNILLQFPIAA